MESAQTLLKHMLMFLWTAPLFPTLSYNNIINGQVKMVGLTHLQWRYWITVTTLCTLTYFQFFVGYAQRFLNVHREACSCDFVRSMSKVTPIEALFMTYGPSDYTRNYLLCRETCP